MQCNKMRLSPVFRSFARHLSIIAVFVGGGWTSSAVAAPFPAYQVRLEIVRNGIFLGAPEATVLTGTPIPVEVLAAHPGALRVMQRVTAFPGAPEHKALLELEILGASQGALPRRLAAPTLGVSLGHAQTYELRTDQGSIRIRATVDGLADSPVTAADGLQTFAYPGI